MTKYDILLWDADGTLFDFQRAEEQALSDLLRAHGLPNTPETHAIYKEINQTLWAAVERGETDKKTLQTERFQRFLNVLGHECDVKRLNNAYLDALGRGCYLLPGAEEISVALHCQGYTLAIITNGIARAQRPRLERSALHSIFSEVFISEEIGYEKPHSEFFNIVLTKLGNPDKRRCLILGDSLTADIQGGHNAGIDSCWFNPAGRSCDATVRPTYEIQHYSALWDILH